MGIGEPQQTEQTDDNNLADNRKAVDQKGADPASDRRFDQIQHVHKTALNCLRFPRRGRILLLPAPLGADFKAASHAPFFGHAFSYSCFGALPSQIE
jgi:hypothetical protein